MWNMLAYIRINSKNIQNTDGKSANTTDFLTAWGQNKTA